MKEQLEEKEIQYMRGKTAGHEVRDHQGNTIISKGDTITDDVIRQAKEKGELHYLMLSAAASVVQAGGDEARQRMQEFRDITEGHEADFVRGRPVGRDVRDFQGNVIARQGDTVTDDLLEQAEEEGLLQELVLAVGAPGFHAEHKTETVESPASKMGYTPYPEA